MENSHAPFFVGEGWVSFEGVRDCHGNVCAVGRLSCNEKAPGKEIAIFQETWVHSREI